jgi:hypothetical protein
MKTSLSSKDDRYKQRLSNVRTSADDHDHSFETHEKDELLYEDLSVGI